MTTTERRARVSTVAALVLLCWIAWTTARTAVRVVAQSERASPQDVVAVLIDRFEQIEDAIPVGSTVGYATNS